MLAPDTEAPAEMHWYIEEFRRLRPPRMPTTRCTTSTRCGAPDPRPAGLVEVPERDDRPMGRPAEVMFAQHHWPVWGKDGVVELLNEGRDAYRYINDQTLRLANHGHTPREIAEKIELPPSLANDWAMRGYYGTVNHNVKAIYSKYLGWFDGNPATSTSSRRWTPRKNYVEFMGGADDVREGERRHSTRATTAGSPRW